MKFSDAALILSLNDDDEVFMIRPVGGGNYTEVRAAVDNFLSSLLSLVTADTIAWTAVNKTGSDLADLVTKSHTSLDDIGINSHIEIDDFIAAHSPAKVITFAPVESDFNVHIKEGTIAFTVPALLNGYNLTDVLVSVHTPGTGSGATAIQIRRRRAGINADMLSTKVTVGVGEYFANDGVINTSNDDLLTGDQIYADIDELTATPPTGLSIALTVNNV